MTKKVRTITTEEINPEDIQPGEAEVQEIDPSINELMDYLDGISTSANLVKIYKIVEGRKAYCGQTEPGALNEDAILSKWGGGSYYLLAFYNGQFVKGGSRRIELYQAPPDSLKQATIQPENTGQNSATLMLQEQINRQHEMMLKLLESQKQPQMSMAEIVGMMRDMNAMAPKPADISTVLPIVMDLFTKTMDVARDSVGGEDSKSGWLRLAAGALEKLPMIVGQVAMARGAANAPAMVQPTNGEGEDPVNIKRMVLAGGIGWLKNKAKAGKPVESIADFLLDNIDDETFGPAAMTILNEPFENLGVIDPEILKEPLRTWFKRLYDDLQGAIKNHGDDETETNAGPSGGDANARGNEAPDD